MTILLTPEQDRFVRQQVAAGRFGNAEEVLAAALASLGTTVNINASQIPRLREAVQAGIAQADRGEFAEFTAASIIAKKSKR